MRLVIQRVQHASVAVDGECVGAIQQGLLVLVGIATGDDDAAAGAPRLCLAKVAEGAPRLCLARLCPRPAVVGWTEAIARSIATGDDDAAAGAPRLCPGLDDAAAGAPRLCPAAVGQTEPIP